MKMLDIYGRRLDGKYYVFIQNGRHAYAIYANAQSGSAEYQQRKIEQECEIHGRTKTLIHYYKKAKLQKIKYQLCYNPAWCY